MKNFKLSTQTPIMPIAKMLQPKLNQRQAIKNNKMHKIILVKVKTNRKYKLHSKAQF
jgi:hypothetical protein